MTTALAQQLKDISQAWGVSSAQARTRGKPSLLLSPQQAADTDLRAIYDGGRQGFEQLIRLDVRFEPYTRTLFNSVGLDTEREQQTAEEHERVGSSLDGFLSVLSPFFLRPAAFKVLEYLVRRYKVQQYNTNALIRCALPYHSTPEFVKVIRICHLENSIWAFLRPMQENGTAMPRSVLAQRCANDMAVLRFICEAAKPRTNRLGPSPAFLAFYGVLVCEVLATSKVTEDLVALLLPYMLAGLPRDADVGYRSATLMIVVQLAATATLADSLFEVLVQKLAKNAEALSQGGLHPELQQHLMVLCHLPACQPQLHSFPSSAVQHLARVGELAEALAGLRGKGVPVLPLVQRLVAQLQADLLQHPKHCALLHSLVERLPLRDQAHALAGQLLVLGLTCEDHQRQELQHMLRALERRYPQEVDAAINAAMSLPGKHKHKLYKSTGHAKNEQQHQVFQFVQGSLNQSAHSLLSAGNMTLAQAVDSPSAAMRAQALLELDTAAQAEPDTASFLHTALLRRLRDEDWAVLGACLDCSQLAAIPLHDWVPLVVGLVERASHAQGGSALAAHKCAATAIAILAKASGTAPEQVTDQVLLLVLRHLWLKPTGQALQGAVLQAIGHFAHPLLSGLTCLNEVPAPSTPGRSIPTEQQPETSADGTDRGIVLHLAQALSSHAAAQAALARLLPRACSSARHLLLLAANSSMLTGTRERSHVGVADAVVQFAVGQSEWLSGLSSDDADAHLDAAGLPLPEHSPSTSKASAPVPAAVAGACLLQALQHCTLHGPDSSEVAQSLFEAALALPIESVRSKLLQALLQRLPDDLPPAAFLTGLLAGSTEPVAVAALTLLQDGLSSTPSKPVARSPAHASVLLTRLLAGTGGSASHVRRLSVACLERLHLLPDLDASIKAALVELGQGLAGSAELADSDASAVLRLVTAAMVRGGQTPGGKSKGRRKSGAAAAAPTLTLSGAAATCIEGLLVTAIPQLLGGSSDSRAASVAVQCLAAGHNAAAQLATATQLLQQLLPSIQAGHTETSRLELTLQAIQLVTPGAISAAASDEAASAMRALLTLAAAPAPQPASPVRAAAASQLSPEMYLLLQPQQAAHAIQVMLETSRQDPSEQVRAAANAALISWPISAEALAPLLRSGLPPSAAAAAATDAATPGQGTRSRKRAKGAQGTPQTPPSLPVAASGEPTERQSLAVLELLQWKAVQQEAALLVPLRALLLAGRALPQASGQPLVPEDEDGEDRQGLTGSYAQQLVLHALQHIVDRQGSSADVQAADVAAVAESARLAPDGAARNAALATLSVMAQHYPELTLQHALEVLPAVGASASLQEDAVSQRVAGATLGALAPAWLAAGRPAAELTAAVLHATPSMSVHRRTALLAALLPALPAVDGLTIIARQLLANAVPQASTSFSVDTARASVNVASALFQQASEEHQILALTAAMRHVAEEGSSQPVMLLTTAFGSELLHGKSRHRTHATSSAISQAYRQLVQQLVSQLQASLDLPDPSHGRRAPSVVDATYTLLQSLQGVMPADLYLQALMQLAGQLNSDLARRAWRLLAGQTRGVLQLVDAGEIPGIAAGLASAAAAAVALPSVAPVMLQHALATLAAIAQACKGDAAPALLPHVPAVLGCLAASSLPARVKALEAASILVGALGTELLPVLPSLLPAVTAAAADAVHRLPDQHLDDSAGPSPAPVLPYADNTDELETGEADLEGDAGAPHAPITDVLDTLTNAQRPSAPAAAAAQPKRGGAARGVMAEAAAGLAAVQALLESPLADYLAPQLPMLLKLLLQRRLLACASTAVAAPARAAQAKLPDKLPARLLIPALAQQLDTAIEEGEAALQALLAIANACIIRAQAGTVASHADGLWSFLLRALDLRQRQQRRFTGRAGFTTASVARVEGAVLAAMVGAVEKLTEAKFRPLFTRMLDWSSSPPAASPDEKPTGRQAALFAAAAALTQRLRAVFVPYYRHLLDPLLAALDEPVAPVRKKRKKAKAAETPVPATGSAATEADWHRRVQAVRAVRELLLNDSTGFVDEPCFQRLLPALVQQLGARAPAAADAVSDSGSASATALPSPAAAARGAASGQGFANLLSSALVQLALTSGSDVLWKALHRQVLMALRRPQPATRIAAVEVVGALASALKEDYLAMLPEALPFLSELLEDLELPVRSATQQLLDQLEKQSGEKLDGYLK